MFLRRFQINTLIPKVNNNNTLFTRFPKPTFPKRTKTVHKTRNELEKKLMNQDLDKLSKTPFDVIIIGSGMGGGTLGYELLFNSDPDKPKPKVLILEKGGIRWTSHVLNTSRPHGTSRVYSTEDKTDFDDPTQDSDLLFSLMKEDYHLSPESQKYVGGSYACLGGKSTVWGVFAPHVPEKELKAYFPNPVVNDLMKTYYQEADALMKTCKVTEDNKPKDPDDPKDTKDPEDSKDPEDPKDTKDPEENDPHIFLNDYFKKPFAEGKFEALEDASLAVQFKSPKEYVLPSGAFSTVDGLLEYLFNKKPKDESEIVIYMDALRVTMDETGKVKGVMAKSQIDDQVYYFSGKTVVLAAGTVGSAEIALRSGLKRNLPKIGEGITDHHLWYSYIKTNTRQDIVPPKRVYPNRAYKLQVEFQSTDEHVDSFLLNIAINSDIYLGRENQNRTRLPDDVVDKIGAITYEFATPLQDNNQVTLPEVDAPRLHIVRPPLRPNTISFITTLTNEIIDEVLKGECAFSEKKVRQAAQGCVAHEVGTLRMGSDSNTSVVNSDLKFHHVDNLYACDLSVFPVSPTANPSPTLVALAIRLAKHINNKLPASNSDDNQSS